jgi:hypothetical protein
MLIIVTSLVVEEILSFLEYSKKSVHLCGRLSHVVAAGEYGIKTFFIETLLQLNKHAADASSARTHSLFIVSAIHFLVLENISGTSSLRGCKLMNIARVEVEKYVLYSRIWRERNHFGAIEGEDNGNSPAAA